MLAIATLEEKQKDKNKKNNNTKLKEREETTQVKTIKLLKLSKKKGL